MKKGIAAAAGVLAALALVAPIETSSRCSDGWTFDGTTLRFSHEIVTAPPDAAMPLVLRIAAR